MLIDFTDTDNVVKRAVELGKSGDLSQATRQEIDEILYWYERPWNSYHASGFPMHFDDKAYRKAWLARRAVIQAHWNRLHAPLHQQQQIQRQVRGLGGALEALMSRFQRDVVVNVVR